MKKIFIFVILFILFQSCTKGKLAKDENGVPYANKDIASIDYQMRNGYSGYELNRKYDLINLTYYESEKDKQGFIKENIYSNLDQNKVENFRTNITNHGIYNLKKNYKPWYLVTDSKSWDLTITFTDGLLFKSEGYHIFPSIKDVLDEDFYDFSGHYLFMQDIEVPNPDDVYRLKTITFVNDGHVYKVKDLRYQFPNDDYSFIEKFKIDATTEFQLIKDYDDFLLFVSILAGEDIENIDYIPENDDSYWLIIKRIAPASNYCYVDYNLIDVKIRNIISLKINYLNIDDYGDTALFDCYDLVQIPSSLLKNIEVEFTVEIYNL